MTNAVESENKNTLADSFKDGAAPVSPQDRMVDTLLKILAAGAAYGSKSFVHGEETSLAVSQFIQTQADIADRVIALGNGVKPGVRETVANSLLESFERLKKDAAGNFDAAPAIAAQARIAGSLASIGDAVPASTLKAVQEDLLKSLEHTIKVSGDLTDWPYEQGTRPMDCRQAQLKVIDSLAAIKAAIDTKQPTAAPVNRARLS